MFQRLFATNWLYNLQQDRWKNQTNLNLNTEVEKEVKNIVFDQLRCKFYILPENAQNIFWHLLHSDSSPPYVHIWPDVCVHNKVYVNEPR